LQVTGKSFKCQFILYGFRDNNTASWWHPSWSSNTSGHKNDTAAWSEGGSYGYSQVKDYIAASGASGVQNGQGGHWITLDLGSPVDNLAAIAQLGRTQANRFIEGYEIYVSNSPIKWDVSGATLVAKGSWGSSNSYQYARFVPQTARYIQIRQLKTSEYYGCVANLQLQTSTSAFPGLDKSMLLSAYVRGSALLKTLDPSTTRHKVLSGALSAAAVTLSDENLEEFPLAGQSSIDAAAESLLAVINALDPPKKPPED
jgi:hypothetical protein